MIKIERVAEPDILTIGLTPKSKGEVAKEALCESYTKGIRSFKSKEFKKTIYAHASVKRALFKMQHGKCCFCESKTKNVAHLGSGDVEHFRPKSGYQQQNDLSELGYYWLAYQWNNLLLSCESCNRLFKKNLFPLLDDTQRAKNHNEDINNETELLINPCEKDPEEYISFHEYVPYAIDDNPYGNATIEILNLKNRDLEEARKEVFNQLKNQLTIIKKAENKPNDSDWQELANEAKQLIQAMALPQAKYSAMIKAALHHVN
jgi:uncharacterized protein (TIGR02646 family)